MVVNKDIEDIKLKTKTTKALFKVLTVERFKRWLDSLPEQCFEECSYYSGVVKFYLEQHCKLDVIHITKEDCLYMVKDNDKVLKKSLLPKWVKDFDYYIKSNFEIAVNDDLKSFFIEDKFDLELGYKEINNLDAYKVNYFIHRYLFKVKSKGLRQYVSDRLEYLWLIFEVQKYIEDKNYYCNIVSPIYKGMDWNVTFINRDKNKNKNKNLKGYGKSLSLAMGRAALLWLTNQSKIKVGKY